MSKQLYNLTGSQNFYGQKDVKTYYSVPGAKVWNGIRFMAQEFNLKAIFVYEKGIIGKNVFVGTYSAKYDNFRTASGMVVTAYTF